MKVDIITIFPNPVETFLKEGIFRIAREKGHTFEVHDLRNWTNDRHHTVDDRPFGGGPGMVMKIEPMYKAIQELKTNDSFVILTGPRGIPLKTSVVKNFSQKNHLIIICGHYEGVDYRVREQLVDEEVSIGPYVLSGGELPALVITDSVVRQLPGVLGNPSSLEEESFEEGIESEYPQYTRPEVFKGWSIPEVLKSGNHDKIKKWRLEQVQKKP